MCGIAGCVAYERDVRRHHDVVDRMTETMARREPDAEGIWLRDAFADVLPPSIVERRKSPYPATTDPTYERTLRTAVSPIAGDRTDWIGELIDLAHVSALLERPMGDTNSVGGRATFETVHGLSGGQRDTPVELAL